MFYKFPDDTDWSTERKFCCCIFIRGTITGRIITDGPGSRRRLAYRNIKYNVLSIFTLLIQLVT